MSTTSSEQPPAPEPVIISRLIPPRLARDLIERRVLTDQLAGGLAGRLVLITAPAGYGKTTLLAQALEEVAEPWIWLTCDPQLAGPALVVAHLAAGLGRRFPGVASRLELMGPPEAAAGAFCAEIAATIAEDLVIVIDDAHALLGTPAEVTVGLLVQMAPPNVHLAIASRVELPMPRARLELDGQLIEIGESELAMGPDEASALASRAGAMDDARLSAVMDATGGWPAALVLAARADGPLPSAHGPALMRYLAEEVIGALEPDLVRFLSDTCLCDRVNATLTHALVGPEGPGLLRRLEQRHLLTAHLGAGQGWVACHSLLREHLIERLADAGPNELDVARRRTADAWLALDEPREAIPLLLDVGAYGEAAQHLSLIAPALVMSPEAPLLAAWLARLPDRAFADNPGLMVANGQLALGAGDLESATAMLEAAADQLLRLGMHRQAAETTVALLHAATLARPGSSEVVELAERMLSRLDPDEPTLQVARVDLAVAMSGMGRIDEAQNITNSVERLRRPNQPAFIEGHLRFARSLYVEYPKGRLTSAIESAARGVEILAAPESDPLNNLVFVLFARGWAHKELGDTAAAWADVEHLRRAAEARGIAGISAVGIGWLELAVSAVARDLPRLRAALERYGAAFGPDGPGLPFRQQYLAFAAFAAALAGDRDGAIAHAATARNGHEYGGGELHRAEALIIVAEALLEADHAAEAHELAAAVADSGRAMGAPLFVAKAAILGAQAAGSTRAGNAHLEVALTLTEALDLEALWTRRYRTYAAELLGRAITDGLGPMAVSVRLAAACGRSALEHVINVSRSAPADARAALAAAVPSVPDATGRTLGPLLKDPDATVRRTARRSLIALQARPRPAVRVGILGTLELSFGGTRLPVEDIGRPQVRELLAILATHSGGVHQDQLCEWLWPDRPVHRARRSLQVAISELRGVLDPGGGEAREILRYDAERYVLSFGSGDEIDLVQLRARATTLVEPESLDARAARLADAARLYRGAVGEEWPYASWTEPARTEASEIYTRVLVEWADALTDLEEAADAVAAAREATRHAPESEATHRALMRAYAAAGERALALRQFHACRALFHARLGVEPSAETRILYASLL